MRLLPVLCVVFAAMVALSFGAALALDASGADKERRRADGLQRLRDQDAARMLPIPSLRSSQTYGAPYNVTITCTVAGSSEGENGERVALDPNGAPRPGDLYVKTCVAR